MVGDNLRCDFGDGDAEVCVVVYGNGDVQLLVGQIGDVHGSRNLHLEVLWLVFVHDVPVGVVGVVFELECQLIVVVTFGIEVVGNILAKHKSVDNRSLRAVVLSAVNVVPLHLDIRAVRLIVFA